MRKIIWSKVIAEKDELGVWTYPRKDQGEALFHQWGIDSPCEGSTFSTAIIELEDGTIKNIPAGQVRFISGEIDNSTELEKYKKQVHGLNEAIEWALGYDTAHEILFDPPPDSKPRYWWRKILAQFRDEALKQGE